MSLNKVMLIGNVGKDPEVHYKDNGLCIANLTLATTDRARTLPDGTQVPEKTEWHNLVFWRKLAETVEKYVHKGDKLYVEGSLRTRSYDDQNGVHRYYTEVQVDNMEMLTPKSKSQAALGTDAPAAAMAVAEPAPEIVPSPFAQPSADAPTVDNDLPF